MADVREATLATHSRRPSSRRPDAPMGGPRGGVRARAVTSRRGLKMRRRSRRRSPPPYSQTRAPPLRPLAPAQPPPSPSTPPSAQPSSPPTPAPSEAGPAACSGTSGRPGPARSGGRGVRARSGTGGSGRSAGRGSRGGTSGSCDGVDRVSVSRDSTVAERGEVSTHLRKVGCSKRPCCARAARRAGSGRQSIGESGDIDHVAREGQAGPTLEVERVREALHKLRVGQSGRVSAFIQIVWATSCPLRSRKCPMKAIRTSSSVSKRIRFASRSAGVGSAR